MIKRLSAEDRQLVLDHLLRLSRDDRYTRFCAAVGDDFIKRYALDTMMFDTDAHFGVLDGEKLVAFGSCIRLKDGSAELAFSIDEGHRGTGIARSLMKATIDHAREGGVSKLCMSCLRMNKKMQALAKSFGLNLTITYDEAYAELGITR